MNSNRAVGSGRYDRAVGRQGGLGAIRLRPVGYRKPRRAYSAVSVRDYWNAGVNVAYGNTAKAHGQLGDLFNDIMGAVVPGWDQRPEALKQIVVRPDPQKLIAAAQKLAPNAAGQIFGAADKYGVDVMVNTPLGQMKMSEAMARGLYSNAGMLERAYSTVASVPMWVWLAGAGGLFVVFGMTMKRR